MRMTPEPHPGFIPPERVPYKMRHCTSVLWDVVLGALSFIPCHAMPSIQSVSCPFRPAPTPRTMNNLHPSTALVCKPTDLRHDGS
jgi:hypothetical protein